MMLEHKGIAHRVVEMPPGTHAAGLRALGFRGGTVPALKLERRRVQGSRAISRALEEARPEPRLFPPDPERRIAVEEAERWGEEVLQEVPRRLARWLTLHRADMRRHMARETGIPLPRIAAVVNVPVARHFARKVGADDEQLVRRTLLSLPDQLGRVEALIADGTIGGRERSAADFQIASTVRCLLTFEDLAPLISDREACRYSLEVLPDYPTTVPEGMLPAQWLAELRAQARS
jgi:glutathione S-transferase